MFAVERGVLSVTSRLLMSKHRSYVGNWAIQLQTQSPMAEPSTDLELERFGWLVSLVTAQRAACLIALTDLVGEVATVTTMKMLGLIAVSCFVYHMFKEDFVLYRRVYTGGGDGMGTTDSQIYIVLSIIYKCTFLEKKLRSNPSKYR